MKLRRSYRAELVRKRILAAGFFLAVPIFSFACPSLCTNGVLLILLWPLCMAGVIISGASKGTPFTRLWVPTGIAFVASCLEFWKCVVYHRDWFPTPLLGPCAFIFGMLTITVAVNVAIFEARYKSGHRQADQ